MKSKSLLFVLSMALALGVIGCKTKAKSEATAQNAQLQNVSPPLTANDDNSKSQNANALQEEEKQENKSEPPSYTANPEPPPPPPSSKGLTREVMKNVDFHPDDLLIYRIRTIRGSLLRR
jgi:type IV secretory pathway VirB10-like protein